MRMNERIGIKRMDCMMDGYIERWEWLGIDGYIERRREWQGYEERKYFRAVE